MKALILCGGLAKRLRPTSETIPKALVEVKGKTLLQRQLEWLGQNNIKDIILMTGHLSEKIWEKVTETDRFGLDVSITMLKEDSPLGTGGAVKNALECLKNDEVFLLLNVDDITDIQIEKMKTQIDESVNGVMALANYRCPYGVAHINPQGYITGFAQKPILPNEWVNCGILLLRNDRQLRTFLPDKGSIEDDVYPKLLLRAFKHTGKWVTINTEKDTEDAERTMR